MNKIKIALIDSGVNIDRKEFEGYDIKNIDLISNSNDSKDTIGHGTAIAYILLKNIDNLELFSIKIFEKNYVTTEDKLLSALNYIYCNLNVNIIHISNGLKYIKDVKTFYDICNKLKQKGTIIVSAFENQGVISYPAKFDNVIGVSWYPYLRKTSDYVYVKNSIVNILAYSGIQNLPWLGESYKNVSGASFSSPYITAKIASIFKKGICNHEEMLKTLELDATSIITFDDSEAFKKFSTYSNNIKDIKKAIVFPISKESHSLLGNKDLLNFDIVGAYDLPQKGLVGKKVDDFVFGKNAFDLKIQSFKNINWTDDFDTVILGHTKLLDCAFQEDFIKYFTEKCGEYSKNLYLFDGIDEINTDKASSHWIFNYSLNNNDVHQNTFGKLNKISKPLLCICGTSSHQGKFNIQLELRRSFINDGYYVGQLGTEPTSLLFGMDYMLHNGYNSKVSLNANNEVYFTNMLLSNLSDRDIIILGLQSQTIPYSFGNLGFYTMSQHNSLIASEPDAVILAVNYTDDIDYINRTITYLESYINTKVIALVLYPYLKNFDWNLKGYNSRFLTEEEITTFKNTINVAIKKKVFLNGNDDDMKLLYNTCIDFFCKT